MLTQAALPKTFSRLPRQFDGLNSGLTYQHEVDASLAKTPAFTGSLLHRVTQTRAIRADAPVSHARPVDLQNLARPALAHVVRRAQVSK